jgi:hypothetical protein
MKGLRQFDAALVDVEEVAVVQRLQPEVVELQVALRAQRLTQPREVVLSEPLVEQFGGDAPADELREVLGVALAHLRRPHLLAEHLLADRVQQQPRGGAGVGRVILDQRARGQDGRLVHLVDRHAVVEVAARLGQDGTGVHLRAEPGAGRLDERAQRGHVQGATQPAVGHLQHRLARRCLLDGPGPLLRAPLAVQHVGARHLVVAAAHQAELDAVLHVLDVESAAARPRAQQRAHDRLGQVLDRLAHAGRRRALGAMHGQECLHQRDRDLLRLERDHRSVAADDLVTGVGGTGGRDARCGGHGRAGAGGAFDRGGHGSLHAIPSLYSMSSAG